MKYLITFNHTPNIETHVFSSLIVYKISSYSKVEMIWYDIPAIRQQCQKNNLKNIFVDKLGIT